MKESALCSSFKKNSGLGLFFTCSYMLITFEAGVLIKLLLYKDSVYLIASNIKNARIYPKQGFLAAIISLVSESKFLDSKVSSSKILFHRFFPVERRT